MISETRRSEVPIISSLFPGLGFTSQYYTGVPCWAFLWLVPFLWNGLLGTCIADFFILHSSQGVENYCSHGYGSLHKRAVPHLQGLLDSCRAVCDSNWIVACAVPQVCSLCGPARIDKCRLRFPVRVICRACWQRRLVVAWTQYAATTWTLPGY